jgi:putative peptidoglycan lipid II flippase
MAAPDPAARPAGQPTLGRAVQAVFSVTLLSRLGGLVRDVIVARLFGDTALGSAFAAAFTIPNTFRRLFGEGALSAAFIPLYTQARAGADPRRGDRFASLTLMWLGLLTGVLTVLVELVLLTLLLVLPGDPERDLSLRLIMVMLPFMPLICIAALLAGMLQVHGRFAASATGPLLLNTFIIALGGYFLLTGRIAGPGVAYALGAATVLSGLTQALWFAFLLRRHARFTLDTAPARSEGRLLLRRFLPVLLGLGTLQVSSLIDMLIAMWPIWIGPTVLGYAYPLDERSNVLLSAMQRLYQFPLGVFGIAVATAAFPLLSRHAAAGEAGLEDFRATLRRGLRISLCIGLPASVGLILVRHDIAAALFGAGSFGHGGFSAEGLARCSAILVGYAPAIWAYSFNHVLNRAFYARGDTATPTRVAIVMVLFGLALSLVLIWPLREAGLAWSTSITATVQAGVLGVLLSRRLSPAGRAGGGLLDRETLVGFARVAGATLLMTLACVLLLWLLRGEEGAALRWRDHALRLGLVTGAGLLSFAASAWALRLPELRWLIGRRGG